MVNYDGIAIITVIFQHHSTILNFLECLESSLLPKACLQPPLFYLKSHHRTPRKNKFDHGLLNGIVTTHPVTLKNSNSSLQLRPESPDPSVTAPYSSTEVTIDSNDGTSHIWNQVFAVRCGSRPAVKKPLIPHPGDGKKSSLLMGKIPGELVTCSIYIKRQLYSYCT